MISIGQQYVNLNNMHGDEHSGTSMRGKGTGIVSEYIFWGYREANGANGLVLRSELHEEFQRVLSPHFTTQRKGKKMIQK